MLRLSVLFTVFFGMILVVFGTPAHAQDGMALLAQGSTNGAGIKVVGAGLAVLGAGLGIGWIGSSACNSIARQPEMAARIQTAMIIAAALIEGAAFAAILFGLFATS